MRVGMISWLDFLSEAVVARSFVLALLQPACLSFSLDMLRYDLRHP